VGEAGLNWWKHAPTAAFRLPDSSTDAAVAVLQKADVPGTNLEVIYATVEIAA
jgi:hypothetical protein